MSKHFIKPQTGVEPSKNQKVFHTSFVRHIYASEKRGTQFEREGFAPTASACHHFFHGRIKAQRQHRGQRNLHRVSHQKRNHTHR